MSTSAGDSDDFMSTLGFFFWREGGEVIHGFRFLLGDGMGFLVIRKMNFYLPPQKKRLKSPPNPINKHFVFLMSGWLNHHFFRTGK